MQDLGSKRFPFWELIVILKHQPLTSAFARAQRGNAANFHTTDYLLTAVVNTLRGISWQLGGDSTAPKPEPYYPPGTEDPEAPEKIGDTMSIEEMQARLEKYYTREE